MLRALLEREGPVPHFSAWVLNELGADVIAKLPVYAELVIEYPLTMELQFQLFWENRRQADPMHEELLFDNLIREHIATELAAAMSARGVSNEADVGVLAYNVFGFVIGAISQWLTGRDDVMLRAAYRRLTESALQVLFGSAQGSLT